MSIISVFITLLIRPGIVRHLVYDHISSSTPQLCVRLPLRFICPTMWLTLSARLTRFARPIYFPPALLHASLNLCRTSFKKLYTRS